MANFCTAPNLPNSPSSADFVYFLRQFNNYLAVVAATADQKVPLLCMSLGRDGLTIFDGLKEPKGSYADAVLRLEEYYVGSTSVLFYEARQWKSETISAFACRLRALASECNFSNAAENLRDMFVIGVANDRLGERLLAEDDTKLTFDLAVSKATQAERAAIDRSVMNANKNVNQVTEACLPSQTVNYVTGPQPYKNNRGNIPTTKNRVFQSNYSQRDSCCAKCGFTSHTSPTGKCPAAESVCNVCGKTGHWGKVCRSARVNVPQTRVKPVKYVNAVPISVVTNNIPCTSNDTQSGLKVVDEVYKFNGNSEVEPFELFSIGMLGNVVPDGVILKNVCIDNVVIPCVADTGAALNVMPVSYFPDVEWTPCTVSLKAFGCSTGLRVVGKRTFNLVFGDKQLSAMFIGVDVCDEKPLLNQSLSVALGILAPLPIASLSIDDSVFKNRGSMKGVEYKIRLKPESLSRHSPPRRMAPAILEKVKCELLSLKSRNIIEETTAEGWCSPIVPVIKKNGSIRICVDFRYLNTCIQREHFQMPTLEDLLTRLQGATVFSTLDACSGYHQIPVASDSQKYLVFSTPMGTFKYKSMPFGVNTAPEIFQKAMEHILSGLEGCVCYMDDVLVFGKDQSEHDRNLAEVMKRIKTSNLQLNRDKCSFGQKQLTFLGHVLSANGICPDKDKQDALAKYPIPTTVKEVRSFLGLAGYVGQRFIPGYSNLTAPIWRTIVSGSFAWNKEATAAFEKLKMELHKHQSLQFFDNRCESVVKVDASGIGIGGVLLQNGRPILFASRKLTEVEQRYAQIEKEFLAIVFVCQRFKTFLLGNKFKLFSDNSPLISFFRKPLATLPLRIQRWMMALQFFDFDVSHISGKDNFVADALSRAPSGLCEPTEAEYSDDFVCLVQNTSPLNLSEVAEANKTDDEFCAIALAIRNNWSDCKTTLAKYFANRHQLMLTQHDTLLIYGDRVVVPKVLRQRVLQQAHAGHMGQTKMKEVLRTYFYWPGMSQEIDECVRVCPACITFSKQNKSAPMKSVVQETFKPWEKVAVDITGPSERLDGHMYLSVIDYHSRYPFLFKLKTGSSSEIIACLSVLFSMFGVPHYLVSDNGPNLVSDQMESFLISNGIVHNKCSIYYPQANGVVERLHGTVKNRVDKLAMEGMNMDDAIRVVLTEIRSSPNSGTGFTPFFLLFGREMTAKYVHINREKTVTGAKVEYNKRYQRINVRQHSKVLDFEVGTKVVVRNGRRALFQRVGFIVRPAGRGAWVVKFITGYERVVNQRYIRRWSSSPPVSSDACEGYDVEKDVPCVAGHGYNDMVEPDTVEPTRGNPNGLAGHGYNLRPRQPVSY